MKKNTIIWLLLVACLIAFIVGFVVGRSAVEEYIKTENRKGETISGSVSNVQLYPVKEEVPEQPILPIKPIIKEKIVVQIVDTATIIAEYEKKRAYTLTAFDNKEYGKLQLYPTLQYNRLVGLDYDFTPMIRETTIRQNKVWQPYISGSFLTMGYVGAGGGLFYHNLGFEYQYLQSVSHDKSNGHLFGLKYKF